MTLLADLGSKRWRMDNLYHIVNKSGQKQIFNLNAVQQKLFDAYQNQGSGIRSIILKARQTGVTTFHCIYFLDEVIWNPNRTAVIIAHDRESLEKFFRRIIKYAYDNLLPEIKPSVQYNNVRELYFDRINSTISVALRVRSGTVNHLHVSELAYVEDPMELKLGSYQAVPKTGDITCESTANGLNFFYHDYTQSKHENSIWTPYFFPWHTHLEYTDTVYRTGNMDQELIEAGCAQEQINWYYGKLWSMFGDVDAMRQEYPTTDEEAFRMSGEGIFKSMLSQLAIIDVIAQTEDGLYTYREYDPSATYYIGVDPSGGFEGGDWSVAYVIDDRYRIYAVLKNQVPPHIFARLCQKLGEQYNDALLIIEANNYGTAVINEIKNEYMNIYYRERRSVVTNEITKELGWWTNDLTRGELIKTLKKVFFEKIVTEIPNSLYTEMTTFTRNPKTAKIEAENGCHDDEILAFGIAVTILDSIYQTDVSDIKIAKFFGKKTNFEPIRIKLRR